MNCINRVELLGNLGADPDVRYTTKGQAVANFRIATEEHWTDSEGRKQTSTQWHSLVVWGASGEACGKHLMKGSRVYAEGRMQTRAYTDKEGGKHYVTEVVAARVIFLDGRRQPDDPATEAGEEGALVPPPAADTPSEEQIPDPPPSPATQGKRRSAGKVKAQEEAQRAG